MPEHWPLLESQQVFDCGLFQVARDRARSPRTDAIHDFHVVRMVDWLLVVALDRLGKLVMVRQYRHGSRAASLEVPGGLHNDDDSAETQPPEQGAARELAEETGYGGGKWRLLGKLWPQPALLSNRLWVYLALDVNPIAAQNLDAGEDIEVTLIAPKELGACIARGEINNAMTLAALYLAQQSGHL
ncbi:MAG: NUDIX hydrolase [Proteobacteria bacterium]|nr:NUDIX hydrolase [Pseudomonadota bacterium]